MAEGTGTSRRRLRWPVVLVAFVFFYGLLHIIRDDGRTAPPPARLRVLSTFTPMTVLTANLVEGVPGVRLETLVTEQVSCPHSYSLSGDDLKKISDADIVVANGLGVEPFLDQITKTNRHVRVLTVSDDCDLLHLSEAERHQHEHEHAVHNEERHDDHEHHADSAESDVNPHTWMSPRQSIKQVQTLARKLAEVDPQYAERYQTNAKAYAERLEKLAVSMEQAAQRFANRNIASGHPAFDYLARDLGLKVVATANIVPGETGSAAEMAEVIDTIRNQHAAGIFSELGTGDKESQTIARDAGVPVYSLSTVTSSSEPGVPSDLPIAQLYEFLMQRNLDTLQRALSTAPAK